MLDLVDGLGAEQVDLVGNSMGGYFSIAFALAHPERVRRLVLVGAPAGLDRPIPWFLRLWGNPLIGPIISRKGIKDAEELRNQVFKSILVAHPEAVPTDLLETMVDGSKLPGVTRSAYTLLRAGTTLRGIRSRLLIREETVNMQVPTKFLWGDRDAFAPPSSGQELAPRMPNAELKVLHDVGHLPHVDAPEIVAAEVTQFLAEDEVTTASSTTEGATT
jgi:pimeloyl-ACP methyl ester carboxylesterase